MRRAPRRSAGRPRPLSRMDPADVPLSLLYLIDGPGVRAELVGAAGVERDDLVFPMDVAIADVGALDGRRRGPDRRD